jgi:hypothetical protein
MNAIVSVTDHIIQNVFSVQSKPCFFISIFCDTHCQLNYIKLNGLRPAFAEGLSVAQGLPNNINTQISISAPVAAIFMCFVRRSREGCATRSKIYGTQEQQR